MTALLASILNVGAAGTPGPFSAYQGLRVVPPTENHLDRRAGYYYTNWNELYGKWRAKMDALLAELEALKVPELPEYEPDEVALSCTRNTSFYEVIDAYSRTLRMNDHRPLASLSQATWPAPAGCRGRTGAARSRCSSPPAWWRRRAR
jgi:hypothetical protein